MSDLEFLSDHASATSIARRKHDPTNGSDNDSISSVSADSDSDSDSDEDEDEDAKTQSRRTSKICLLVRQILDQIRSLYDLSSLLRRPNVTGRYIRSVNSKPSATTFNDPNILPLNEAFYSSDVWHVREKVLEWRGLTKTKRSISFESEDVVAIGQSLTRDSIEVIPWFCERLARANTRRREQLQYWTDHPSEPEQKIISAAQRTKQITGSQDSQSQASTLKPASAHVPRGAPKSTMSKQSFSTAAVSDVLGSKTNVRPRTSYTPTAVGQDRSNSVQDPPKELNGKSRFSCPYCGMTLESSEMQNRQSWK